MTRPYGPEADPRGSALSRNFVPLALIALGVVFLLSNLVPDRSRGGLIVLGLGAAFLVGRLTTGRYGYAVPAGILSGIGAYIILQETVAPRGLNSGGLFFLLFGLGFGLIYAVGLRPTAIWPLVPAAIFLCLGLVLLGVSSLGPLASFSWIAAYWPVALVLSGAWLLFRDSVPLPMRRPIATFGGVALLAYGVVAAAASIAAGGAPSTSAGNTATLERPISAGQTLTITNSSGSTAIRGSADDMVHVMSSRGDTSLVPTDDGLRVQARGSASYTIEVPSGVVINAESSSGSVSLEDVVTAGGRIRTSSGNVSIRLLPGSAVRLDVHTSSGNVEPQGGLQLKDGVTKRDELTGVIGDPASNATLQVDTSSGNVVLAQTN